MPRMPRGECTEGIYHIINRGNMGMQIFDSSDDYEYFLNLLKQGCDREFVLIHAYCLMPNHFHLLVSVDKAGSLSRMMQWVMTSHVRYYHRKNNTFGHVWQGRYKSFIVEKESYYVGVIRYIEANPIRANLADKAQKWLYGSLRERVTKTTTTLLCSPLVELGEDWKRYVNKPMKKLEIDKIRNSVNRQTPLGEKGWQMEAAKRHGLMSTLGNRGRPKKEK